MTNVFAWKVMAELAAALLILYGIYREQDLVSFEDRIWKSILVRTGIQKKRDEKAAAKRRAEIRRRNAARRAHLEREQQLYSAWEQQANRAEANRRAAATLQQCQEAENKLLVS